MNFCLNNNPREIFNRYAGNPILKAEEWPYVVNSVFNPGATKLDGETILLCRVEDCRGFSHLTVARSQDGKTGWKVDDNPTLSRSEEFHEEQWGLEDPRIVWFAPMEKYAITYTSFSPAGPQVSLAFTEDFETFDKRGVMLSPEDKDASLFPRKFGDRYVLIHRPIVRGEQHIWISFSPDLVHWGEHEILITRRSGWWDDAKVGLGPQPIETEEGWLIIYHGVRETASGSLYRVGLALLDRNDPTKVIKRADPWVMGPREDYEYRGDVPGVVFPTGAVVDNQEESKKLRIYYGAADSSIGVATAELDDLLQYLLAG
ncbi:glycosidase [Candidatus Bipolaricaulota bacterium]|nr:glycosidase [Candidatus Bipolaricaulota bacterium]